MPWSDLLEIQTRVKEGRWKTTNGAIVSLREYTSGDIGFRLSLFSESSGESAKFYKEDLRELISFLEILNNNLPDINNF